MIVSILNQGLKILAIKKGPYIGPFFNICVR